MAPIGEIRLGLIGAGAVGVLHAEAIAGNAGARITAVCDVSRSAADSVASPLGARVFTDHQDLLASGLCDAVFVNTPHALHTSIVVDAASAGLHVLVEKPMATSVKDCDVMDAACTAAGVVLFVGHIQHFLPHMRAAKEALVSGALGDVLLVDDRRSTDYRPGTRPDWFFDPAVAGGGVFMNIGAHCVDRLLWLTGRRVERVTATTVTRGSLSVESDVLARFELAGGVTAHVAVTSSGLPAHDTMAVFGAAAALRVSPVDGTILHAAGEADRTLAAFGASDVADAFAAQLEAFLGAVRGECAPAIDAAHGRHVVEVVRAVYESAAAGEAVVIAS